MRAHFAILNPQGDCVAAEQIAPRQAFSIGKLRDAWLPNTTVAYTLIKHADISPTLLIHPKSAHWTLFMSHVFGLAFQRPF